MIGSGMQQGGISSAKPARSLSTVARRGSGGLTKSGRTSVVPKAFGMGGGGMESISTVSSIVSSLVVAVGGVVLLQQELMNQVSICVVHASARKTGSARVDE